MTQENDASDEHLFEVLDNYLNVLHNQENSQEKDAVDSNSLNFPSDDASSLLECLDMLDSLAVAQEFNAEKFNEDFNEDDYADNFGEASTRIWNPDSLEVRDPKDVASKKKLRTVDDPLSLFHEFGDYELLEELGRGGMGVVFKARQKSLDRFVAIKMILSNHLASETQVRRFHIEAKAAASLRHPNIVAIHEVGQMYGQHYFAMQHIEGKGLDDLIHLKSIEMDTAVSLMVSIGRAVDYLHHEGIMHRDLKPSNILIDADQQPYVTDFGLAKMFSVRSDLTETGAIAGTPSYMSPEQAAGKNDQVGTHSDVYSLGAILYELLVGRPPFASDNPLDTLVQVLESEPIPPRKISPSIPKELERICLRCLEKNPQRRYRSAGALADDLDAFLRGEEVETQPIDFAQWVRRWVRRQPGLVCRLVAIGLCILVLQLKYWLFPNLAQMILHWSVQLVLVVWIAASVFFQWMLDHDRYAHVARFSWAAADVCFLTLVFILAETPPGPLLIGFPLLIAGAGLWFHVRLVVFMTFISTIAYGIYATFQPLPPEYFHHHIIYAFGLSVLGFIVGYQVHRVRALGKYYKTRRVG